MHLSGMNSRPDSVDLRQESTNETLLDGTKKNIYTTSDKATFANHKSGMIDEGNLIIGMIEACQAQKLMFRQNHLSARIPEFRAQLNRKES
jgi:hypothetical protein